MTFWFPFRSLLLPKTVTGDEWPPPQLPDEPDESAAERRISPAAAPVHVMAGTGLVRVKENRLIVERPECAHFERPIELVSALHIHGWAGVTSPAVAALTEHGIPVVWRGVNGYPIAVSSPLHISGAEARRAQFEATGKPAGLAVARALVAAKIVNMKGVARRKATLRGRDKLNVLSTHAKAARNARSLEQLLGVEGAATAAYFSVWPDLISDRAGDIEWTGRDRRPPRDIINVLLSYCYALLAGECLCAVAAAGLDPRVGFLHQPRAGRAALALDLMEPFRPLIADQAVLAGVNTGQIKAELFEETDGGLRFTDEGKRIAIDLVEKRLAATLSLPNRSEPLTFREAIGLQARSLAKSLRDATPFNAMERP